MPNRGVLEIRINTTDIDELFRVLPAETTRAVKNGIFKGLEQHRSKHAVERMRGRPGIIPRHGRAGLAGASRSEVIGETMPALVGVAFFGPPAVPYARIHEKGGTIRAKGKLLTIPAKGTGPDQRMRDFPGGHFVPRAKGGAFYIQGGKLRFILVQQVTIPPRLGWVSTWDTAGEQFVANAVGASVAKMCAVLNAGGGPSTGRSGPRGPA